MNFNTNKSHSYKKAHLKNLQSLSPLLSYIIYESNQKSNRDNLVIILININLINLQIMQKYVSKSIKI